jgi:hypothetical protein
MSNPFRANIHKDADSFAITRENKQSQEAEISPYDMQQISIVIGQSLRKGRQHFEAVKDAQKSFQGFNINPRFISIDFGFPYENARGIRWQDLAETIPYKDPEGLKKGDYEHLAVEGYARHLLKEKMEHMQPAVASLSKYIEQLRGSIREGSQNLKEGIKRSLLQMESELKQFIDAVEVISHKPHMYSHKDRSENLEEMQLREELNDFKIQVLDKIDLLLEREDWRGSPWELNEFDKKGISESGKIANFLEHVLQSLMSLQKKARHVLDTHGVWKEKYGEKEHLQNRHHKERIDVDLEHFDEMKKRALERIRDYEKENTEEEGAESSPEESAEVETPREAKSPEEDAEVTPPDEESDEQREPGMFTINKGVFFL